MRTTARSALLALILTGSGCGMFGSDPEPTTQIAPNDAERRFTWTANLVTPSDLAGAMQVRGTAQWARRGEAASVVTVTITNATPGGVHPWHVHQGRCGDNGPIVGDASAYRPLAVNDKGAASATATLTIPIPLSGEYYVNVHALASNMGTIISCGNLAPPVT